MAASNLGFAPIWTISGLSKCSISVGLVTLARPNLSAEAGLASVDSWSWGTTGFAGHGHHISRMQYWDQDSMHCLWLGVVFRFRPRELTIVLSHILLS